MMAENAYRIQKGYTLAYTDKSFVELSDKILEISKRLYNEI